MLIAAAPQTHEAEDLAWLAGSWVQEKDGSWTEERWAPPRGGMMIGSTLAGRGEKAEWFEYMRLAPDAEGRLAFWASPGGKTAVAFPLASLEGMAAVFENPENDFPTRISYRREGDRLAATISGPGGANAQSWSYTRRRD